MAAQQSCKALNSLSIFCARPLRSSRPASRASLSYNSQRCKSSSELHQPAAFITKKSYAQTGNRLISRSASGTAATVLKPPASKSASTVTSKPSVTSSGASASQSRPPLASNTTSTPIADLSLGLKDAFTPEPYQPPPGSSPLPTTENVNEDATFLTPQSSNGAPIDWTRSFHGLSTTPFSKEAADVLMEAIDPVDIEVKPDGILYLPEIKYRRILNRAFGPGGWGLAPRGETLVTSKVVTREFGLVVNGRLVSVARGEQQYFDPEGIPTATEGCKSNALMRCCKDLGVASELWDPVYLRTFKKEWVRDVWVEHVTTKKKRRITVKKGVTIGYPYKEASGP